MQQKTKSSRPVIEVEKLVKEYPIGERTLSVLRGLDLKIYFGEFAIIYGASGCGKSTLLHTIMGLEPPTGGTVCIKGKDLFKMNDDERALFRGRQLGIVLQQSNWIKSLNVLDNVALPLNIAGLLEARARARALDMLKLFGLEELATRHPSELSGGEQQRVSLARALTTNPWVILADEPTGNLDKHAGLHLMNVLKSLNEQSNRTIVLVTHNPQYRRFATQILQMEDGTITQSELCGKKKQPKLPTV